jgi:hypothetical protein
MVALVVKYDTPGYELRGMGGVKETVSRREMNERFSQGHLNPEIEPPEDGEHLWEWFWHLSGHRHQGMNGPQPLTYQDLETWSRMTGTLLLREELSILMQMDTAFLNAVADEHEEQRKRAEADK